MSGDTHDEWDEDPLPIETVEVRAAYPVNNPLGARRRTAPKAKPPPRSLSRWTQSRKVRARLLIASVARMKCRCEGRSHNCHPCRARAFLKELLS